ncbi:MAG: hypothetical protein WCB11_01015 [Terriglobales bacterium]|jgi:hypothetical protein
MPLKKEQLDLTNAMVWIPDSKTPNGVAEVPLTPLALEAFRDQMRLSPCSPFLFPSDKNQSGYQRTLPSSREAPPRTVAAPIALWINVRRELMVPRGVSCDGRSKAQRNFFFYRTDKIRSPPKKIETIPRKAGATLLDTRSFSLDDLVFAIQPRS